jgi:hypothetical protein
MVRVDLNIISVIGLILGAVAAVLVVVEYNTEADMRLGNYLGPDVPLAEIPLPWVVLFAALVTYAVGRFVWIIKHRGGMPQLPPRIDRED